MGAAVNGTEWAGVESVISTAITNQSPRGTKGLKLHTDAGPLIHLTCRVAFIVGWYVQM